MAERRNLPIGIQTFEELITKNCFYREKCLAILKKKYDGYHFLENTKTDIYNPFSFLNAFSDLDFLVTGSQLALRHF